MVIRRNKRAVRQVQIQTIKLEISVVGCTKNAGAIPKNNAIVVIPKAKQCAFLNFETKRPTVIGIVILYSITPSRESIIIEFPNAKKGKETSKLRMDVFLYPILSAKTPPNILPIPINENSNIA